MKEPDADPNDLALFALVERFVSLLASGETHLADDLLAEHPELAEVAQGLAGLELLAREVQRATGAAAENPTDDDGLDATLLSSGSEPPDASSSLPQGRDFGPYELLEEIGRGAMGVVYRARQKGLQRSVALKMILSSQLAGEAEVKRFQREARAAGQLRHPHIVGIHEVGQVHGQHFFTMEYIPGQSLAELLKAGPLSSDEAARLVSAVARAVDYLHSQGIIHRDLKPSNILIDPSGSPNVTDFGLAKVFQEEHDQTQTGVILGTPGYMPPEQARGEVSAIDCRSDVYSLGAILYEMLVGRPPFRNENPLTTLLQVLENEPPRPRALNSRIPQELERICLKCLEKDPQRRFPTAKALADELERVLRREPLETQPASVGERVRRWMRRDTGLVARLSILAAAATIVELQHLMSRRYWAYHIEIKLVFAVWGVMALVFQRLLQRPRWGEMARLAWAIIDPVLLMVVLSLAADEIGPLTIGYPLLVVASGLWFSVRLVAVSTLASAASYVLLLLWRNEPTAEPHYPVIFVVALAVIGCIVAFQVHRVRTLSRYFEQTQWPRERRSE